MPLHLLLALSLALPADTSADTTYYVTNRARHDGRLDRARGDSLEFGLIVTRFVRHAGEPATDPISGPLSGRQDDSVHLSRGEFLARLRAADARAETVGEGALLYVHGYGTSFRRGLAQGTEIAHRGRFAGPMVVFSWPAHRAFMSWPSLGALLSGVYRDDARSAAESEESFRAALDVVLVATRHRALTVVGHSLGAQLIAEALRVPSPVRDALVLSPLHALVFFAPDISAERFRDSLAAPLAALADRRIVYASAVDKMLGLSRLVNHSPRAGQASGAQLLTAADVEVVDVTEGRRTRSAMRTLFDPRHAMRYAESALYDFFGVVRGVSADCRAMEGIAVRMGERRWRLTHAPIPAHALPCLAASATVTEGAGEPPG
ncbi:MAG TPA: alpha/beta hydrolase [Gemmatimonadaceae bacterium]|nr:alpha/beta hydrolase [Gemmatimonadaceae bacterium]